MTQARWQHAEYRRILESLGLVVDLLPANDAYPDCCFIEDTAVLIGETAIICRTGAVSRRGEVDPVRQYLIERGHQIVEMTSPATLDGGDVLQIESELYVGISRRTNVAGFQVVSGAAKRQGRTAYPVEVRGALHLKTACTYAGQGTMIGSLDELGDGKALLERFRVLPVGMEADAANVSLVQHRILVPAHCPCSIRMLTDEGFDVIPVDVSEFHKAEAGLTCLTIFGTS